MIITIRKSCILVDAVFGRVGHCVLSRSELSVLSRSFKKRSVLSHYFFEFLATYESQKNGTFFPVLFKRTEKNLKNVPFFYKERERTQRSFCTFLKNGKERENVLFFCKRTQNVPFFFQYIQYIFRRMCAKEWTQQRVKSN